MTYKALSSILNDNTRASLTQLSRIQITKVLLKRPTTKSKIVNRPMASGLTSLIAEISHYLTHHTITHLDHDETSSKTIHKKA